MRVYEVRVCPEGSQEPIERVWFVTGHEAREHGDTWMRADPRRVWVTTVEHDISPTQQGLVDWLNVYFRTGGS